jgi:hypothetical protein
MFVDKGGSSMANDSDRYGLGVVSYDETPWGRQWGKGGDVAGYSSEMRYLPDREGATVALLTNRLRQIDPNNVKLTSLEPIISASLNTIDL